MTSQSTKKSTAKSARTTSGTTTESTEGASRRRIRVASKLLELQKRSIERQRSAFDTTFQAVQSFQEGGESAIHNLLGQSSFVPEEWRLMADAWIENARQGRESFREAVDTSYGLAQQFVERLSEQAPAKA